MINFSSKSGTEHGAMMLQSPLEGMLVLDFGQFLSAPSAALRLADLGARVIKVERAGSGDICRRLYISNMELDGDSTLFHSINRNKESYAADLRDPADAAEVHALIRQADVLIQNFRPGVMERLGFHYEAVKAINPAIVYGEITGYGNEGPWVGKPGQDLLVQSMSGLTNEGGTRGGAPKPLGLAVTDMIAGAHLVQGVLSCLVRRGVTGVGARVEVSLLESALDLQVNSLTAYLNLDDNKAQAQCQPDSQLLQQNQSMTESQFSSFPLPDKGIYATSDGYVTVLPREEEAAVTEHEAHEANAANPASYLLATNAMTTQQLSAALEPAGYEVAQVLNWRQLLEEEHFTRLNMVQSITRGNGTTMRTTCCPIRIDGMQFRSEKGSPKVGEDTAAIRIRLIDPTLEGG
ncbi:CaiB/BaiF CoA-transferase family protein [Paenibacillus sp. BC26]|uniref:CaiB/BaiF CoA transferase family protein n=1 Tax=Paenibacillus sp. BC26 TaxID=1881032 RepID=UPI0008F2B6B9|nr:CaiB/BaiF CoA-transferase family protein [Paenibacillus sp. BC26]SFS71819.1 Crotonobetainyl-CoA:carnitine CoA-transferase CaiB [Paenibacillus sp. BC26]